MPFGLCYSLQGSGNLVLSYTSKRLCNKNCPIGLNIFLVSKNMSQFDFSSSKIFVLILVPLSSIIKFLVPTI